MPPDVEPLTCTKCKIREGICTPVVVIALKNYPIPGYLQFKGVLCRECAAAFTLKTFTAYDGEWYDRFCDHIKSIKKPATNPFPDEPSFKWEEFIIKPNWEPVPKEQCEIQFWKAGTLAAKSAKMRLGPLTRR